MQDQQAGSFTDIRPPWERGDLTIIRLRFFLVNHLIGC